MAVDEATLARARLSVLTNLVIVRDMAGVLAGILPLHDAILYELIKDEVGALVDLINSRET